MAKYSKKGLFRVSLLTMLMVGSETATRAQDPAAQPPNHRLPIERKAEA